MVIRPVKPPLVRCSYFKFQYLVLFCVLALTAEAAWGQALPTPQIVDYGPNSIAVGGSSAAIVSNHDAFLTNPANLFYLAGKYSAGGNYQRLPHNTTNWSADIVDGTNGVIGGFQFQSAENKGQFTRHAYTLSAAYKTNYGSLGASVHAMRFSDIPPGNAGNGWHFTNTTGVFIPLGDSLAIGSYGRSVLDFEKDKQLPPTVHMAIVYTSQNILRATFEADRRWRAPNQDWNYSTGGELLLSQYYVVRGGYHVDYSNEDSYWSSGVSLLAPKMEVSGSFIRTATGKHTNGFGVDTFLRF